MTVITVSKALSLSVEDFQKLELAELAELHKLLADSKQKKALRKADLVAGVINSKKKEAKQQQQEEQQQEEPTLFTVGAENSTKAPAKPFAESLKKSGMKLTGKMPKPKAQTKDPLTDSLKQPKPKATPKAPTKQELEALGNESLQEQQKADAKPKAEKKEENKPQTFKRPTESKPDLTAMTQEQLLLYIQQLEEKSETFPQVFNGEKTKYTRIDFENVTELQTHLRTKPYSLYCFVDEKQDEKLTQFLVLFASPEILVVLDRTRYKNTVTTIEMKNVTESVLKFPKEKLQFEYSFYIREKK
jgi:hypothetical protein